VQRLEEKGIGLLELHRGIERAELIAFCEQLADPRSTTIASLTHLLVGAAEVKGVGDAKTALARGGAGDGAISEEALQMQRLEAHAREHQEVRLRDAREIVLALLSHLAHEDNLFFNLADVHRHDLATYQHSCNVATLSMSFGLALGMRGDECFELGAAALLHDIGKTFVASEILNKTGPLDREEWDVVRRHPWAGARMLMRQRDVPRVAVVVAFEHHMHYAGGGGYPRMPFAPSAQSQMVSIIDAFDAVVSRRSYRKQVGIQQGLARLREDRGRAFAPRMFDEFERFIGKQVDALPADYGTAAAGNGAGAGNGATAGNGAAAGNGHDDGSASPPPLASG